MVAARISFQLYSARNAPPDVDVLGRLAALGYDAVEPYGANYLDDAPAFRARADAHGLAIPSAHMPLALLRDEMARATDLASTLGLEVIAAPYLDEAERPRDVEGWQALGATLGQIAGQLGDAGIRFAWHNHDFEYAPLADGSIPLDHLLADPRVLSELDLGWVARTGRDPAAEVTRLSGRLAAVHFKDPAPAGVTADDGWTAVGAGTTDWTGVWRAVERSTTALVVAEHDNPSDWQAFAASSGRFISRLAGRE